MRQSRAEAESKGYSVDEHCYPWIAYKGARFSPDEWHHVLTDVEHEALNCLIRIVEIPNKQDGGDWDEIEQARQLAKSAYQICTTL